MVATLHEPERYFVCIEKMNCAIYGRRLRGILPQARAVIGENLQKHLIRSADTDDLETLAALEKLCYDFPWSKNQFAQELTNPVAAIDCLMIDGTIAGYLCSWMICGEMQILNIATAPAYRRQGIGRRLLEQVLARGHRQGLTGVWLEVRASNLSAILLYENLGFEHQGQRRGYYPDGEDALIMIKT